MDPYYWVQTTPSNLPRKAVKGGNEDDGSDIYVGRASHLDESIPGSVIPCKDACLIPYGGEAIQKHHCEVLCKKKLEWVRDHDGLIAPHSICAGYTKTGETLYVGRVHHNGSLTVGKVQRSERRCYIPFAGAELSFSEYEILVFQ